MNLALNSWATILIFDKWSVSNLWITIYHLIQLFESIICILLFYQTIHLLLHYTWDQLFFLSKLPSHDQIVAIIAKSWEFFNHVLFLRRGRWFIFLLPFNLALFILYYTLLALFFISIWRPVPLLNYHRSR